ncbi:MAG TPA: hypothetical protein VJ455_07875 [Ignavibacteria bacterium]|nr:hypothetical protein [Ignavibacteria bacterium]
MNAVRKYVQKLIMFGFFFAPVFQDLPPGPGEALRTLGAWVLDIGMGLLTVIFALNAYKTGKKTQTAVTEDHEADKPIADSLKKWGKWFLVIILLLGTFILPTLIFGQQGPISSLLSFIVDWVLTAIGIGGGGPLG